MWLSVTWCTMWPNDIQRIWKVPVQPRIAKKINPFSLESTAESNRMHRGKPCFRLTLNSNNGPKTEKRTEWTVKFYKSPRMWLLNSTWLQTLGATVYLFSTKQITEKGVIWFFAGRKMHFPKESSSLNILFKTGSSSAIFNPIILLPKLALSS